MYRGGSRNPSTSPSSSTMATSSSSAACPSSDQCMSPSSSYGSHGGRSAPSPRSGLSSSGPLHSHPQQQHWEREENHGTCDTSHPRSSSSGAPYPPGSSSPHPSLNAPTTEMGDEGAMGTGHGGGWTNNNKRGPPPAPPPYGDGGHMMEDEEGQYVLSRSNSREDVSSRTTSEETTSSTSSGGNGRKRVRLTSEERIQRSRERNRVHARKTRKRKKVQMESIQCMIENLQEEARRMRLAVMEWYTANILLVMRSPDGAAASEASNASDKNLLEKYMRVQAFIESNNGRKEPGVGGDGSDDSGSIKDDPDGRTSSESTQGDEEDGGGIVPAPQHPWNKGTTRTRCKYAPEDRERIRRERNRIHAKRTRDRRKKFMEESEKVLGQLAMENRELRDLLCLIYDQPILTAEQEQQYYQEQYQEGGGKEPHRHSMMMNGGQSEGGGDEAPHHHHHHHDAGEGDMSGAVAPSSTSTAGACSGLMHLTRQAPSTNYDNHQQQRSSPQSSTSGETARPEYRGQRRSSVKYDETEDEEDDDDEDDYDVDDEEGDERTWRSRQQQQQQQRYPQPPNGPVRV